MFGSNSEGWFFKAWGGGVDLAWGMLDAGYDEIFTGSWSPCPTMGIIICRKERLKYHFDT